MKKDILTLGIESSCDETSVSVVKNGREILSNVIDTQIPIHEKYGGVVPEIASRNHIEAISRVTKKALEEANVKFEDIDAITPTPQRLPACKALTERRRVRQGLS